MLKKMIRQSTVSGLSTLIEETNAMTRRLDNEYEIQRSENTILEIPNRINNNQLYVKLVDMLVKKEARYD